jgi:AraC family transcriptional activator of pyochelin receptor
LTSYLIGEIIRLHSKEGGGMTESRFAVVDVSGEMTTVVGCGEVSPSRFPAQAALLRVELSTSPRLSVSAKFSVERLPREGCERIVTMVVMRSALKRLFDWAPASVDGQEFHLPHDLVAIAEQVWEGGRSAEATHTYRLAKSIELLCEIMGAFDRSALVPYQAHGSLKLGDARRLLAARKIIDEHWAEKLTLEQIARRCGLNRTKLSRGFREIYHCSVSEALADRRLLEARRQLISTDLPIGVIGYRSGYLNNASFTRAFGRRFGVPPSEIRGANPVAA